jgi:hypothetical protein
MSRQDGSTSSSDLDSRASSPAERVVGGAEQELAPQSLLGHQLALVQDQPLLAPAELAGEGGVDQGGQVVGSLAHLFPEEDVPASPLQRGPVLTRAEAAVAHPQHAVRPPLAEVVVPLNDGEPAGHRGHPLPRRGAAPAHR